MDQFAMNPFFSLDNLYSHYPFLEYLAINRYQLLTVFWNIFLVFVPLGFYRLLRDYWRRTGLNRVSEKAIGLALFMLWLLFFPNTAYIITDVRHLINYCPPDSLNQVCSANAWMIMFFFFYSSIGWVSFYYLLKLMSDLVGEIYGGFWSKFFVIFIIPVVALGVLLGLLNRFNSWDIFLYPGLLFNVAGRYFSGLEYFTDWAVFTVFLYLLYLAGNAIFRKNL